MNRLIIYTLYIFIIISNACKSDKNNDQYVNDILKGDDYVKIENDGDYTVQCNYLSPRFIVLDEYKKLGAKIDTLKEESIVKQIDKYKSGLCFNIKILKNDGTNIILHEVSNMEQYSSIVSYLGNGMQSDLYIETPKGDKIYPLSYNFYNTYGIAPSVYFTFIFSRRQIENYDKISVVYNDKAFKLSKKLYFNFKTSNLSVN